MEMVEKYNLISNIAYVASGVFLLLAIILFFVFRIHKIIMDLLGITQKRAITRIEEESESGKEVTGSLTGSLTTRMRHGKQYTEKIGTAQFGSKKRKIWHNSMPASETTVLQPAQDKNETTVLAAAANETTVLDLSMQENETDALQTEEKSKSLFMLVQEITYIHSETVIRI